MSNDFKINVNLLKDNSVGKNSLTLCFEVHTCAINIFLLDKYTVPLGPSIILNVWYLHCGNQFWNISKENNYSILNTIWQCSCENGDNKILIKLL